MDEVGIGGWLVRDAFAGDLPDFKIVVDACELFPSEMLDAMIAPYLRGDAPAEFWLTVADPAPIAVGYCAPERMTSGTWNMLLIAVDPARQGRGVGAAIMRAVENRLGAAGERLLLVETSGLPEFSGTRAFYRSLGYGEEARIHDYYQRGEDKVVFCKDLRQVVRHVEES